MFLIDRLQIALKTQIGALFLGLALLLAALVALFVLLLWRQRKRDLYAAKNRAFFREAERCAPCSFGGRHRALFFGRESAASLPEGDEALCLILPPGTEEAAATRLLSFTETVREAKIEELPFKEAFFQESYCYLLYKKREGQTLRQALLDRALTAAEKEMFFLSLAKALERLHRLFASDGSRLYHGFLLPHHLRILEGTPLIDEAGLAFSLGPRMLFERISALQSGKLKIEKPVAYTLLEQLAFLAPEQREAERLEEVGQAADFYAFGAAASFAFTGKIGGEGLPEAWRPFLEQCLEPECEKRPKSFGELERWLQEPELALTFSEARETESEEDAEEGFVFEDELSDIVQEISPSKEGVLLPKSGEERFSHAYSAGLRAFRASRWSAAKAHLKEAVALEPRSAELLVKYAISCYELGDMEEAERHYRMAKESDPALAKVFRKHIAFRI